MSVARVTEIIATSSKGFDDAIKQGINRANSTLRGIKGAWVAGQKVECDGGTIKEYRVRLKVSFVVDD